MNNETKKLEEKLKSIGAEDASKIVQLASDALPREREIVDFLQLKEEVKTTAEETIESIIEFFFDMDKLPDGAKKLLKYRKELDVTSLHTILYQLKTSDYAIAQILNEINGGVTINSVRLFEALNNLQKTNIEATKSLSTIVRDLEEQYSNLKQSVDDILAMKGESDGNEGIARGTRSMFKDISNLDEEITSLNEKPKKGLE